MDRTHVVLHHKGRITSAYNNYCGPTPDKTPHPAYIYWTEKYRFAKEVGHRYHMPIRGDNREIDELPGLPVQVRYTSEQVTCLPDIPTEAATGVALNRSERYFYVLMPRGDFTTFAARNSTIYMRPDWMPDSNATEEAEKHMVEMAKCLFQGTFDWHYWAMYRGKSAAATRAIAHEICLAYNVEGMCRSDGLPFSTRHVLWLLEFVLNGVPYTWVNPRAQSLRHQAEPIKSDDVKEGIRYLVQVLLHSKRWILTIYDRATNELWIFDPTRSEPWLTGSIDELITIRDHFGSSLERGGLLPAQEGKRKGEGGEIFIVPIFDEFVYDKADSGVICCLRAWQFFIDHYKFSRSTDRFPHTRSSRIGQRAMELMKDRNVINFACGVREVFGNIIKGYLGETRLRELPAHSEHGAPLVSPSEYTQSNTTATTSLWPQRTFEKWTRLCQDVLHDGPWDAVEVEEYAIQFTSSSPDLRESSPMSGIEFRTASLSVGNSPRDTPMGEVGSPAPSTDIYNATPQPERSMASLTAVMAELAEGDSGRIGRLVSAARSLFGSGGGTPRLPSSEASRLSFGSPPGSEVATQSDRAAVVRKGTTPGGQDEGTKESGLQKDELSPSIRAASHRSSTGDRKAESSVPPTPRNPPPVHTADRTTRSQTRGAAERAPTARVLFPPTDTPSRRRGGSSLGRTPRQYGLKVVDEGTAVVDDPSGEQGVVVSAGVSAEALFSEGGYNWELARANNVGMWTYTPDEWVLEPGTLPGWCGWDALEAHGKLNLPPKKQGAE